jgi:hypothetical protein
VKNLVRVGSEVEGLEATKMLKPIQEVLYFI